MSIARKFYIICMFLVVSMSANAVQRCVALNSDTDCVVSYAASGDANFVLECDGADGTQIEVQGIGICARYANFGNVTGVALEESYVFDDITVQYGAGSTNCMCKLIDPVESKWVFGASDVRAQQNPTTYCVSACGKICADVIAYGEIDTGVYDPNLRSALLGNLE
ncbi:MAG: hypothetical protein J6L70_00125 [Alphaproteobacteria bacterium]|nr:hypothetical protein [Alphaproteobacteria bacterium]